MQVGICRVFALFFLGVIGCFSIDGHELVDLRKINPNIQIEVRHASAASSFACSCFAVEEVAQKLSQAQKALEKEGYGLKIFEAYRPYSLLAQSRHLDMPQFTAEIYPVEDPCGHSRGTAVDVTLVCLGGPELDMGTDFGVYNLKTARTAASLEANVYHNRQRLEKIMKRYGFTPSQGEWWHFDYDCHSLYPLLDVPYEQLLTAHYSEK